MWSFLTYLLGMSGGDYFTSSHGAPQKQSDKILAQDGAQYLPPLYARIVEHLYQILAEIEKDGYLIKLAALDDPHLHFNLTYGRMARLYANYLRQGPASTGALATIQKAIDSKLRLQLDFFGGAGYRTIFPVLQELGIAGAFEGGLLRCEEDPFFHNIGFRVSKKKGSEEYEVVHDSVDASLPVVVESAGYDKLLADAPDGQMIFNVDPDSDRFVVGQLVPSSQKTALDKLGITSLEVGSRLFALYSPNQFFLLLAENDRVVAVQEGSWQKYSNFDVHTYVSALAWDEWAAHHHIPVGASARRLQRKLPPSCARSRQGGQAPGQLEVKNELGEVIAIGANPKLHHAGEESGGKIGGPSHPIYNMLGESVLGMREKSSGEACVSAVSLAARLWLESERPAIRSTTTCTTTSSKSSRTTRLPTRWNLAATSFTTTRPSLTRRNWPKPRKWASKNACVQCLFHRTSGAQLCRANLLAELSGLLAEAMPAMAAEWQALERIDRWSDGLQFWFAAGGKVRDLCLRPSGTDAKTKVYLDGTDKAYLQNLFEENFKNFVPNKSQQYQQLVG